MKLLPARPPPKTGESFGSWVHRVATANGAAFEDFAAAIRVRYGDILPQRWMVLPRTSLQRISPDVVEHPHFVAMMAAATGLKEESLETFTVRFPGREYRNQWLLPSGKVRLPNAPRGRPKTRGKPTKTSAWYPESYCPRCLAEDYFLRRSWRPALPSYCSTHHRVLAEACPRCQKELDYYSPGESQPHFVQGGSLFCGGCQLDLGASQNVAAPPQHQAVIRFLGDLLEGGGEADPPGWGPHILNAFHCWAEAFFFTCTGLRAEQTLPPMRGQSQRRSAYIYQPARVRFALLATALKTVGRLGQGEQIFTPEDDACAKWLGPAKWREWVEVARNLVAWFPELNDQEVIAAPDRSILLPILG